MGTQFQSHALKALDRIAGSVMCNILPPLSCQPFSGKVNSILVIRPGGIGDAVLLIPTICALKHAFPQVTIDILAEKRNGDLFSLCEMINNVLLYDSLSWLRVLSNSRYDLVIDTEQWYRLSAVVARLIKAPMRIGFATNERRRMFTHCIPYDQHAYEAGSFVSLLKPLGVDTGIDFGDVTLEVPNPAADKAAELLEPLGNDSFVTIFPGASIKEKRWGSERFRQVVKLLSAFGIKTVVVGGKEDRRDGEFISGDGLALNLAGLTSLSETAAVIQKSSLLVSGDSGVLHIAAGLGVPTVSLFGPGRVEKWAPKGERHIVITKGLPCSPCTLFGNTPPCQHKSCCMSDITAEEVANAVTMLLTSTGAMASRCCKRDWIEIS